MAHISLYWNLAIYGSTYHSVWQMESRDKTLLALLRAVGKRPQMYIGDPVRNYCSIWHLKSMLVGYQIANFGRPPVEGDDVLDSLTFWVCTRYGVPDGPMDWAGHLWRQAGEDDEAAFRLFFALLEDYIRDREQIGPEVIKTRFLQMLKGLPKNES